MLVYRRVTNIWWDSAMQTQLQLKHLVFRRTLGSITQLQIKIQAITTTIINSMPLQGWLYDYKIKIILRLVTTNLPKKNPKRHKNNIILRVYATFNFVGIETSHRLDDKTFPTNCRHCRTFHTVMATFEVHHLSYQHWKTFQMDMIFLGDEFYRRNHKSPFNECKSNKRERNN